jgi:hypothetical protein
MTDIHPPQDLPREELIELAGEVVKDHPGAEIYFKFTCEHCGERCTLQKPNVLYESGECWKCGKLTPIAHGGFMVALSVSEEDGAGMKPRSDLETVCDFCSGIPIVKDYDCPDYTIPVKFNGKVVELGSSGQWAACQACADLIDRGNKEALMARALQAFYALHPGMPASAESAKFIYDLHSQFWERKK